MATRSHMLLALSLFVTPLTAQSGASRWEEKNPGVWTTEFGHHDTPTLTEASGATPLKGQIEKLSRAELPFKLNEVKLTKSRDYCVVSVPLKPGEKIFGLGMQMSGINRRGGVYHLQVDHFAEGHDRLHAPTPMYISSLGYAVFLNTSRPTNFYVGVGNRRTDPKIPAFKDRNTDRNWDAQPDSGQVEASVQAPGLEITILAGPTAMQALQRYNLFCGGGAMPPRWAVGFWHRTPSLATASQVSQEVDEFAKRGFPLDVIGLEPGWQSRSYPGSMEWSPERFPNPKQFVSSMAEKGIHVNLWENPYVAPGSSLFKKLESRFGSHTVWLGAVPDVFDSKASKTIRDFHTDKHLNIGVSGYKIDEVDGFDFWLWPDHATFPSGLDGLQMRQIYGVLWQKLIDKMYREKDQRTFGLVRGSNGAASKLPFAIYSDTYDHHQYITALLNSSLAGVTWCAEIRSADSNEEWVRRMQSACLSPIAQLNAWDSGKKPWSYPAVSEEIREAMLLRESLVPYLYTAFAQYRLNGVPPVRPMCLIDGGVESDQYMLGDNLLFAPMFVGANTRTVRLPAGKWYDYSSGKFAGSSQTITIAPSLSEIPLYVRGGAAIPTIPGALRSGSTKPCLLRCYGEGPYVAPIYEDDGISFGFEQGHYFLRTARINAGKITTKLEDGLRPNVATKYEYVVIAP